MARHLILILEGALSAYGGEMVDARGPVRDWPGASLLTGLFANALGYNRAQRAAHARLQARIDFAVRIDRPGERMQDYQTAQLAHSDQGWTTRGTPEGREGGASTYKSPHIRWRDYFADSRTIVALALRDAAEVPTLDDLAAALSEPVRPLFLGRKPCLPTRPILEKVVEAADPLDAITMMDPLESESDPVIVVRDRPGLPAAWERLFVTDERDWVSGVHAGERIFRRGRASRLAQPEGPAP
ncbi:MAG: type I-E CRISPR-associated protein Cas5/CasD [Beijerinckiaceae bacterium]|nr:MAG: type I-E CRISPR-associated protein Cas5/CasD [Beijerinckiaceae bacterium]